MVEDGLGYNKKSINMKNRLLKGWTFKRAVYLAVGITTIIMAFQYREWLFSLVGIYFAAMGLFAFGCASGNCYTGYYDERGSGFRKQANDITDIHYEEVK
jgi:hypothetical protein